MGLGLSRRLLCSGTCPHLPRQNKCHRAQDMVIESCLPSEVLVPLACLLTPSLGSRTSQPVPAVVQDLPA